MRWILVWLVGWTLLTGCSSHVHRLQKPRQQFLAGDLLAAQESLSEQLNKRRSRDRDVLALDLAIVQLCQGQPREAEQVLRHVRDRFDHLEQASIAESFTALMTDDQRHAYAGEDYEKVLVRVFLALSNLMHDGGDVESYCLQINEKQEQLFLAAQAAANSNQAAEGTDESAENAIPPPSADPNAESAQPPRVAEALPPAVPLHLQPLAVGPYLNGVLKEATHRHYDDAQRAYEQVVQLAPEFTAGPVDLERARFGHHSERGHGALYVIGLIDRGPIKVEQAAVATSEALLIADRVLSAMGPHQIPPTLAPVKIPVVQVPYPVVSHLAVELAPQQVYATETICDIGQLAVQYDEAARADRIARAVVRRVVKKSAVVVAKDQVAANSAIADLAMTAAGVAWEATESADTRCWGLLPRAIQVRRCELPAGRYQIPLRAVATTGEQGPAIPVTVDILDGRNTYVLGYFPDLQPIGQILVGSP